MTLLVLFDGNGIIHRAFHALPPFAIQKTGETVGAVYGFTSMLLKVMTDLKPTNCAIAFDKRGPTFRHEMYEHYKATRKATPNELLMQVGRVRQVVETFRIPIFELDGFEADDVLGALSRQAAEKGIETIIVTGDADAMQLVAPHVRVMYPKPGRSFSDTMLYDEAAVQEKYGVPPKYIPDLKGLVGDTSDNIPGVRGIGDKTAVKLIQQFGGIEQIYGHIEEVTPARVQAILRENEDIARQSKKLATIVTSVPVKLDIEECHAQYDRDKVVQLFRELEFFTLVSRLPEKAPAEGQIQVTTRLEGKYEIIKDSTALDRLLERVSTSKAVAVSVKGSIPSAMSADLWGVALSPAPEEGYYITLDSGFTGTESARGRLKSLLEDASILKYSYNSKYDLIVLANAGVTLKGLGLDVMIGAHLLGDKNLALDELALTHLGIERAPDGEAVGSGARQLRLAVLDTGQVGENACRDVDLIYRLADVLDRSLHDRSGWTLLSDVEMPLVPVLAQMEMNGVKLDTARLRELSQRLGEQISDLEKKIYDAIGHEFNINSPQQLGSILFDQLRLPTTKKGKARYSTEASILEELRGAHIVIDLILEIRQLSKLKSTYVDALPTLINPRTGRVHTSFNQTRTATGRLSSTDPNIQNIPVRSELGREVRQAFIAPPGSYLLAGDYSQIDLRALAHLSQDAELLRAFRENEDIHTDTATKLFGVGPEQVSPEMRRLAKVVNFGVIYGMSEYGLEQATKLSRQEAGQYIDAYFEKHPGVKQYLEATKEQARKFGWVQTLLGRRRYIPEINSTNRIVREAAERMAINMPVQGTSADIIKVAMIDLCREMDRRGLKSKMLLQVHDELVFEVPEAEVDVVSHLVPELMCAAVKLSVPVKVDVKTGTTWGQME